MINKRLIVAYERMMERIKAAVEENPGLLQAIELARKTAIELGELDQKEAERLANYLQRDLIAAVDFIQREQQSFKDWLALDWLLVEAELLDLFNTVADKSYIERLELLGIYPTEHIYYAHEVTGIGSLYCIKCGQTQTFLQISEIAPCQHCGHTEFKRGQFKQ